MFHLEGWAGHTWPSRCVRMEPVMRAGRQMAIFASGILPPWETILGHKGHAGFGGEVWGMVFLQCYSLCLNLPHKPLTLMIFKPQLFKSCLGYALWDSQKPDYQSCRAFIPTGYCKPPDVEPTFRKQQALLISGPSFPISSHPSCGTHGLLVRLGWQTLHAWVKASNHKITSGLREKNAETRFFETGKLSQVYSKQVNTGSQKKNTLGAREMALRVEGLVTQAYSSIFDPPNSHEKPNVGYTSIIPAYI